MSSSDATVLAVIPARGGSKSLPRKNVLPLAGRPLLAWTIAAARNAHCVRRVIVSTEDEEIAAVARAAGAEVPFPRPAELATDTASSVAVLRHAVEQCPGCAYVVLLQPTSPLRTAEDIDSAFALLRSSNSPSCVSICAVEESPWWMYRQLEDGRIVPLLPEPANGDRRQDLPSVYRVNGALYLARTDWFLQEGKLIGAATIGYRMPRRRSVDIDTRADFECAARILSEGQR